MDQDRQRPRTRPDAYSSKEHATRWIEAVYGDSSTPLKERMELMNSIYLEAERKLGDLGLRAELAGEIDKKPPVDPSKLLDDLAKLRDKLHG